GRPLPGGGDEPAAMELVRLALPRRVYTQSHIDYVAEVVISVASRATELAGFRITSQAGLLRHFTARVRTALRLTASFPLAPLLADSARRMAGVSRRLPSVGDGGLERA